jgi:hypothetical protein
VNIAQVCRKAPTATLRRAFVRALRELCQQSQWLLMTLDGSLTANTQKYVLGNDPELEIIGIKAMSATQTLPTGIQTWPLTISDSTTWDPNMPAGMPTKFCYIPEAQFAVQPIPSIDYGCRITIVLQPKEGAVSVPEAPLLKYSNEVEAGAMAYLMSLPGQPWSNPGEAMKREREFRSGISNAKADAQRAFNIGPMRVRPRQFLA